MDTMTATYNGIKFANADIVNIDDWPDQDDICKYRWYCFLLHDHGFALAVVFADNLQDALDIACDDDRLKQFEVSAEDFANDYDSDEDRVAYLGNAGEMHDIETIGIIEIPIPPKDFAASFTQMLKEKVDK